MTSLCKALHVLPRAGGLLDQDSYHVYGMSLVLEAFQEAEQLKVKQAQQEADSRTRRR